MRLSEPIILTGASGFIGRRLVEWLRSGGVLPNILRLRGMELEASGGPRVQTENGGNLRLTEISNAILIHLAWCPPVRDRAGPHATQVKLLADLLDAHGGSFSRVIGLGSAEEYGAHAGRLLESDAANEDLSPYGWGKRSAQTLLNTWSRSTGKPALWLRPFLVYGEGQAGNMVIPYAIRQAIKRERADFSAGEQRRDFIHVDDVARSIGLAAGSLMTGFAIANVGTGVGTRLRDALETIARIFDAQGLFHFGGRPMRPGEPSIQIAATEEAERRFAFKAEISLEQGLTRIQRVVSPYGIS